MKMKKSSWFPSKFRVLVAIAIIVIVGTILYSLFSMNLTFQSEPPPKLPLFVFGANTAIRNSSQALDILQEQFEQIFDNTKQKLKYLLNQNRYWSEMNRPRWIVESYLDILQRRNIDLFLEEYSFILNENFTDEGFWWEFSAAVSPKDFLEDMFGHHKYLYHVVVPYVSSGDEWKYENGSVLIKRGETYWAKSYLWLEYIIIEDGRFFFFSV